ncbi:MAG: HupE/UreJ family protein [Methylocella sp.]
MTRKYPPIALALIGGLIATPALAHTGLGDAHGFAHGFAHPLGGLDHELAMVAVGVFAAQIGGRALWLVPLSFIVLMTFGGALGVAGVAMPFVEICIACSIIALGALIALRVNPPIAAAMGLVGFFALFHGHAHGSEMPAEASGLAYGLGFILATAALHAVGVGLGLGVARLGGNFGPRAARAGGMAMAVAGVGLLTGFIPA